MHIYVSSVVSDMFPNKCGTVSYSSYTAKKKKKTPENQGLKTHGSSTYTTA